MLKKLWLLQNNQGFTLTEMTIVLMIVTVVSSISFGNFKLAYDAQKRNEFIFQLKQDLHFAQQMAISHNSSINVVFLNGSKQYQIRKGGNVNVKRPFHEDVTFVPGTLSLHDITFLQDGNARKSGTLVIKIGTYKYRLVLQLGRGRFYIEEI